MRNYYIDIETGPLPYEERKQFTPTEDTVKFGNLKDPAKREAKLQEAVEAYKAGEGCALDPLTGKVLLVGLAIAGKPVVPIHGDNEADILRAVWDEVGDIDADRRLIGFNLINFDLRFMIRRSWVLGVEVPDTVLHALDRYNPVEIVDLMRVYALGDRQCYVKQDTLLRAFGLPVYTGSVKGAEFSEWWEKDRDSAIAYNVADVEACRQLAARMGVPWTQKDAEQAREAEADF